MIKATQPAQDAKGLGKKVNVNVLSDQILKNRSSNIPKLNVFMWSEVGLPAYSGNAYLPICLSGHLFRGAISSPPTQRGQLYPPE